MTRVLFVDDEPLLLKSLSRQLRGRLEAEYVSSVSEAMEKVKSKQFNIVISDMRMPEMNGDEFLEQVSLLSPESIRVMFTGNSDQESAVRAINKGKIFRFISKPSTTEDLLEVVADAEKQHALLVAKRELLQNTLTGSIKLVTDLMGMSGGRTGDELKTLCSYAKALAEDIPLYELELPILLCGISRLLLPEAIEEKILSNKQLTNEEFKVLDSIPSSVAALVRNIPRLENVADTIETLKLSPFSQLPLNPLTGGSTKAHRIIHMLMMFQRLTPNQFRERLNIYPDSLTRRFLALIRNSIQRESVFPVDLSKLLPGQVLLDDVVTKEGVLLMRKGKRVTEALIPRLRNYALAYGIREPLYVDCLTPTGDE